MLSATASCHSTRGLPFELTGGQCPQATDHPVERSITPGNSLEFDADSILDGNHSAGDPCGRSIQLIMYFIAIFLDETSTRRWRFIGAAGLSLYRADTCHRHGHCREQREE